jgi:solute:Na+ symporter, SSS family
MSTIDWIILILFILASIYVATKSRLSFMTMKDFAIDKQTTSGILVFASLSAAYLGPGFTIGLSEQGYSTGLLFFFVYLGFTIQTILIGLYVAPKLRAYHGAYTVGDIIGFHYGKFARIFTGLISMLYCAGIVGIVAKVSGHIIESLLGLPFTYGVIISTTIVLLISLGGMRTILFNDYLQFITLAIPISIFCLFAFAKIPDLNGIMNNLPKSFGSPFSTISLIEFIGIFSGFLLGEALVPPYTNRAFVSKDIKNARTGFFWAGVFSLFWFAMIISIGIIARALLPNIDPSSSFIQLANYILPAGFLGLIMIALISIIWSTQDAFLQASAVSFIRDIYESFKSQISDRNLLRFSRLTTIIIGVLGILFALNGESVINALLLNYTFWAPTVVLPLIIAVLMPTKVKPLSGIIAILLGGISVGIWEWGLNNPFGIKSVLVGIIMNQIGFWGVHFFFSENKNKGIKRSSGCTEIIINK